MTVTALKQEADQPLWRLMDSIFARFATEFARTYAAATKLLGLLKSSDGISLTNRTRPSCHLSLIS